MKERIVFGSRGSDLALVQTHLSIALLRAVFPGIDYELQIIQTTGDKRLDIALDAPGQLEKGLFTKELEEALLKGEIDAAVHSLKDLPTTLPDGLAVGAVLPRESDIDCLLNENFASLDDFPAGARIGTSSPRRRELLQSLRADLEIVHIRGNVPTRLRKIGVACDGVILAKAGLSRLELLSPGPADANAVVRIDSKTLQAIDLPDFLPAPGQGAIAIEMREDDLDTAALLQRIHDPRTSVCVQAERDLLEALGGGCHLPLGVRAVLSGELLSMEAVLARDGIRRAGGQAVPSQIPQLVLDLAGRLRG